MIWRKNFHSSVAKHAQISEQKHREFTILFYFSDEEKSGTGKKRRRRRRRTWGVQAQKWRMKR
jgi:hypothetical protein